MYRVAILGCENSHADKFLDEIINKNVVENIEIAGVYSEDRSSAERLREKYGVLVADSVDAFVDNVDGIMITARHGDNHYQYAKPYIKRRIPMFIDKPITCSEEDARAFMAELVQYQIPVCGGSTCVYADYVQELKRIVQRQEHGRVLGGFVRGPIVLNNPYGGFFFYAQHLIQIVLEIFGYKPISVQAVENEGIYTCLARYEQYDVNFVFTPDNRYYYAGVHCERTFEGSVYQNKQGFTRILTDYSRLLENKKMNQSYEELFAPVYVMNALERAIKSGKEERILQN